MTEQFVQVTEGTGKKLHTYQRSIGGNLVQDEVVVRGEPYLAAYCARTAGISTATAASHTLQIMAGASLRLYIREIHIWQMAAASAAASGRFDVVRLTTAGSGGTAIPTPTFDPADTSAGATAQALPSTKGTEGDIIMFLPVGFSGALPATEAHTVRWVASDMSKAIIVAAGTSNGIAIKCASAIASATVAIDVVFSEASF